MIAQSKTKREFRRPHKKSLKFQPVMTPRPNKSGTAAKMAKIPKKQMMVENPQVEPEQSNCSAQPIQSG